MKTWILNICGNLVFGCLCDPDKQTTMDCFHGKTVNYIDMHHWFWIYLWQFQEGNCLMMQFYTLSCLICNSGPQNRDISHKHKLLHVLYYLKSWHDKISGNEWPLSPDCVTWIKGPSSHCSPSKISISWSCFSDSESCPVMKQCHLSALHF